MAGLTGCAPGVAPPHCPWHTPHMDPYNTWRADGTLAGAWPPGARHACGSERPRARQGSGGSWPPGRSPPPAWALAAAPRWPVPWLPPPAVGSAQRGARRRGAPPMLRQGRAAWDQPPPEPLEGDAHRPPEAAPRHALHQPACAQTTLGLGEEGWRAARDALPATGVAVRMWCAMGHGAMFLHRGRLALWTDVPAHHGVLWPSAGGGRVFRQP